MRTWNRPPVVRDVFYEDFSKGIRGEVWRALNEKWSSQHNNGYAEENCLCTTAPRAVEAEGATGGLVVIRSNGDFAKDESKKRQGGGIVTKRLFGPGFYEVRMKVVPRAGQCSAMWTYFNDWAPTLEKRRYSEIDTELPHGGDYRVYSGTTYENYVSGEENIFRSEVIRSPAPLNDGRWHTLAFEWRTDRDNGDEAVVWYRDGEQVLVIGEAVPHYTATFWIASLFQDAIAWLGDPQFETAYLYVDWVKITEYTDPVEAGGAEKESKLLFTGVDLRGAPVPHTDYIANGDFSAPARTKNFKGREICSWELSDGAEIENGALLLRENASACQTVTAQYEGYRFEIEAEASVKGGGGLKIYLEFLSGKANCVGPVLRTTGRSKETLSMKEGVDGTRRAVFTVEGRETEHVRVRLETDGGTFAAVKRICMKLL